MEQKTHKLTITAIAGGIEALERLMKARLTSWIKIRVLSRLYDEIAVEIQAYNAEIARLSEEFPERQGEEYERRLAMLVSGEVIVSEVELTENDFLSPEDFPSPSDMYALKDIITFA